LKVYEIILFTPNIFACYDEATRKTNKKKRRSFSMVKKLIAGIVTVSLCISMLAGCGSSKEKETDTSKPASTSQTTQEQSTAPETTEEESPYGDTGGLKLPVVDQEVTVSWMLVSNYQDLSEKDVIKEIGARTNVKLDIQSYPSASYADKLQITLASGTLPDIITGSRLADVNKLGSQGAFVAINKYLDELPNFKSLYVDNEENNWVMKSYSDDQGNIYTWPIYGLSRDVNHGFLYRKDIFDKHGIKEWTNTEEFYQALKKLKEIYPDSIPYASKTQTQIFSDWAYGWGIGSTAWPVYYDEATGLWKLATIQPEFKDMIDFMKKLYNEGLLDPEFITDTAASWTAKMTEKEKSFVTFDWIGRLDMFYEQVKDVNPEYNLRYANPVGPTGHIRTLSKITNFGTAIANNKNALAALKMMDYLTSPSGSELITMGIKDKHFVFDENGKVKYPYITDVEKIEITTLEERYGCWVEGMYLRVDPRSSYFNYTEKEQEAQDKINSKNAYEPLDPELKYTDEETSMIAELTQSILKASNEFAVQYIMDKKYGDAQWNEWLAKAEKLGASQLEKIHNDAQKRYNSN